MDVSTQKNASQACGIVSGWTSPACALRRHKFADEIVLKIGGGIPGVGQTSTLFLRPTEPGTRRSG